MLHALRKHRPATAIAVAAALATLCSTPLWSTAARSFLLRETRGLAQPIPGATRPVVVASGDVVGVSPLVGAAVPEPARHPAAEGFLGVVLARTSSDVAPRFDGRLATVNVRVGDSVSRGSVLATITVPTLAYDLRVAEAELQTANLDVDRATTELSQAAERSARQQRLDEANLSPADEVRGAYFQARLAKTRLSSAQATAAERHAQVDRLRQDDKDTRILAPIDGVVAARYAEPGTSVHALVPVVRLITTNDVMVRFAVSQAAVARLSVGSGVHVETTETQRQLHGSIERIAAEVEPASHMIFVEARIDESEALSSVPSGELARVRLDSEER